MYREGEDMRGGGGVARGCRLGELSAESFLFRGIRGIREIRYEGDTI